MLQSSEILERFRRSYGKEIDLTLRAPYRDLLAKLGDPHLKLPPVIHVAGTNGKGSTCAFMRAALESAGHRVHVYTSPHLVHFHERIRLNGRLINEDELVDVLSECERLTEPGTVTFFEVATAAAFTAFARHPADACILEVGMGGRLDATNVVPAPAATVITRLSLDHREYLGETLDCIAREKAGIMRTGVPCFAAPQPSAEAVMALKNAAETLRAPLVLGERDWRTERADKNNFRLIDQRNRSSLALPVPALTGSHQMENAGLALMALSALPLTIGDDAKRQAMLKVRWPARLQLLKKGALVDLLPREWELWLDGGHNDSAGEALAVQMRSWRAQDGGDARPLYVIFGMLSTKNPREFLAPMAAHIDDLCAVGIEGEPLGLPAEALARMASEAGIRRVESASTLVNALKAFDREKTDKARILICGSLYLAGQVLRHNRPETP